MSATPPPAATPPPSSPAPPPDKRPSALLQALRPADADVDPAALAQFKGALLTVAGGVVATDAALLTLSAQRTKPLLHTDYLVASLLLASAAMALILLALAPLNLGAAILATFRRLALTACLLGFAPLLIFAVINFAPGNSQSALAADLFGVTLDPPIARQMRRLPSPDPGLQALLRGNSLKPETDPVTGVPLLNRTTTPIGPLARRVAQPLYDQDGNLPGSTEVDHGVDQRLVPELLALRTSLNDFHRNIQLGGAQVEPWTCPELYELQIYVYSQDARLAAWTSGEEAQYLPLFHDFFRELIVRFLLFADGQPLGDSLAGGDDDDWSQAFDTWFFAQQSPPPSIQYGLNILSLPVVGPDAPDGLTPSQSLEDFLNPHPQEASLWTAYDIWAVPGENLYLEELTQQAIQPALPLLDATTSKHHIERAIVQPLATAIVASGTAFVNFHRLSRSGTYAADPRLQPELHDFQQWILKDELTLQQWQQTDTPHAAPMLLTWLVQLTARFAMYITDDPERTAHFQSLAAAGWNMAYRDWFVNFYLPEVDPEAADRAQPSLQTDPFDWGTTPGDTSIDFSDALD